jgi:hypothetical protein
MSPTLGHAWASTQAYQARYDMTRSGWPVQARWSAHVAHRCMVQNGMTHMSHSHLACGLPTEPPLHLPAPPPYKLRHARAPLPFQILTLNPSLSLYRSCLTSHRASFVARPPPCLLCRMTQISTPPLHRTAPKSPLCCATPRSPLLPLCRNWISPPPCHI